MKRKLKDEQPDNQQGWDDLWNEIGTYFNSSVKEDWFDLAAKLSIEPPPSTDFGHSSKLRGEGTKKKESKAKGRGVGSKSDRAEKRLTQLQQEIWEQAKERGEVEGELPGGTHRSRAIAQLAASETHDEDTP